MVFKCQICNINPSKKYLTKCCKLYVCQQCKTKYQQNCQSCVCSKPIINKKLCTQNQQLFKIISQFESKKLKQCDRCTQIAKIQCKNCNMIFCRNCEKELHNSIGYSKHIRQEYVQKQHTLPQIIQKTKKKQKICQTHKISIQHVCQCSSYLCSMCVKSHKQECQKKCKPFSQFRSQYFSQILFKLSQITAYKQSLTSELQQYKNYHVNQKQSYQITLKALTQQFTSLKKILQIKISQTQGQLNQYWQNCQRVYSKTTYYIENNIRKYDDYAKLLERFAEQEVGLDYLEKRVKRVQKIQYNSFNFKITNIDQVKNSILNLDTFKKQWDYPYHQNIAFNIYNDAQEQKKPLNSQILKKSQILASNLTSDILFDISQNPLKPRTLSFNVSHNQIQFNFIHLPYHQFKYEIQYGVGFKMKGKQVFKKIQNKNGKGIIQGLNPTTKYRIRMKVVDGDFGDISQVMTLDQPKFNTQSLTYVKITGQNSLQFIKQGIIYGTNPLIFGTHYWTIILNSQKCSYQQSQTACISLGVSSKQNKKAPLIGSTFNYGYQREQIILKMMVNCEQNYMTIRNMQLGHNSNFEQEKFSLTGLNTWMIYPAIQNKSSTTVHIKYSFGKDETN